MVVPARLVVRLRDMKTILAFLLISLCSCFGQLTNLSFSWDAAADAVGYRFYSVQGTNRTLLGTTSNLTFIVTNWNVSTSRTVMVSATNMLQETMSQTLTVPPAPASPQNLKTVPLSIVSPVPGVLELSPNLVDWTQRFRLAAGSNPTNVLVTWLRYPTEPMMFMRTRAFVPLTPPPLPTIRPPP